MPARTSATQINVALSLVKGGWDLNAQKDINLQEVRNPNGVYNTTPTGFAFNKKASAGSHRSTMPRMHP